MGSWMRRYCDERMATQPINLLKLDHALKALLAERAGSARHKVGVIIGIAPGERAPSHFAGVQLERLGPVARSLEVSADDLAELSFEPWVKYIKSVDLLKTA